VFSDPWYNAAHTSPSIRKICGDYRDPAVNIPHNHRMKSGDKRYLWQRDDWPHWTYDHRRLAPLLGQVHQAPGHLLDQL